MAAIIERHILWREGEREKRYYAYILAQDYRFEMISLVCMFCTLATQLLNIMMGDHARMWESKKSKFWGFYFHFKSYNPISINL